ncbi:MAG: surface-adhesin E family protein [Smithella sp.]
MKIKNVQRMVFLLIFVLFATQAWAEDWVLYDAAKTGNRYYEKNSIKKAGDNIFNVWTIKVYNKEGKAKDYYQLTKKNVAPQNPDALSFNAILVDVDCKNNKFKINAMTIYDKEKKPLFSAPASLFKWDNIVANTSSGKLKSKICK